MRGIIARLLSIALCCFPNAAMAGAWTQEQGSGQAILTTSYYQTGSYLDNKGHEQSEPTYSKYELNPYLEYGITDTLTAGASLYLDRDHQDALRPTPSQTSWGLGDSEFFLRQRLWQQGGFVISAQPMIELPSPTDTMPKLGDASPNAGLGLSGGYGFDLWGLHHFADIDTQYVHRFGTPKDQINLAGTLGIAIAPSWVLMPQAFLTYRAATPKTAFFTNSSADDYNLVTLQLSLLYKLSADLSLQLGAFSHVAGRNTSTGNGGLFAIWKNF